MAFNLSSCPSWWSEANGTGGTPDLRGEFVRWLDNGRWVDTGRTLASSQWDSIRDITGSFAVYGWVISHNGAFSHGGVNLSNGSANSPNGIYTVDFSAADSGVPTSHENGPRNIAFLYCIKN